MGALVLVHVHPVESVAYLLGELVWVADFEVV
jgi:hypothetical protein